MTGARIRFGIVGTGGIANTHAAALTALGGDAEIVACCDIAADRAADFANRWGVQHHYDSARVMLDAGVWVRCLEVKGGKVIVREMESPPMDDLSGDGSSKKQPGDGRRGPVGRRCCTGSENLRGETFEVSCPGGPGANPRWEAR